MRSQGGLSIQRMCELAGVSRASFYRHWEKHEPTEAEIALRDAVQRAALAYRHYGYRRIVVLIEREGFVVGAKKVRRLMRQDNLLSIRRRKFVVTTESDHNFQVHPNLAHSRRVIGWALGRTMDGSLTLAALEKAIARRHPQPGMVHHSDRGSQYASAEYVDQLESCGAVLSMSRPGWPWENGRCESFIKTLKQEELDARPYRTMEELAQHLEEFIEQVYNRVRLHSALGYQSPLEFERQQQASQNDPAWIPATMSFRRHREIYSDVKPTGNPGRS